MWGGGGRTSSCCQLLRVPRAWASLRRSGQRHRHRDRRPAQFAPCCRSQHCHQCWCGRSASVCSTARRRFTPLDPSRRSPKLLLPFSPRIEEQSEEQEAQVAAPEAARRVLSQQPVLAAAGGAQLAGAGPCGRRGLVLSGSAVCAPHFKKPRCESGRGGTARTPLEGPHRSRPFPPPPPPPSAPSPLRS